MASADRLLRESTFDLLGPKFPACTSLHHYDWSSIILSDWVQRGRLRAHARCVRLQKEHCVRVLDAFVRSNRDAIIALARERVASRTSPQPSAAELENGIPIFLSQLCDALQHAKSGDEVDHTKIGLSAGRHGLDLLNLGLTIGQVVHDYGHVCQAVTLLAVEQNAAIPADDFRTLNLCLDDAIAQAVTVYSAQRELSLRRHSTERLGVLAHELRNLLNATLAFESIKSGRVASSGSTGMVLHRSLLGLRDLIDRSLAEVRLDAGVEYFERFLVAEFLEEVEIGAVIQANARGLQFAVSSVDRTVAIDGDRQMLAAALANLLQNAFKFTHKKSCVSLVTRVTDERVMFDIQDECGGLPEGKAEELFRPFEQRGADRSGVGLGLSICLKAAKANRGEVGVRNLPGNGCVFTLDLPRALGTAERR